MREQLNINSKLAINRRGQRQPALEPFARSLNFKSHQLTELRSKFPRCNLLLSDAEAAQVLERQIDAALVEIHADILPKVGKLQRCAGEIGKLLAFFILIAANIENQPPYRIGRVTAITEQVVEAFIAINELVLPKRAEQVSKRLAWNVTGANGLAQGNKDRMAWAAVVLRRRLRRQLLDIAAHLQHRRFHPAHVGGVKLAFPQVQQAQRDLLVADLVA